MTYRIRVTMQNGKEPTWEMMSGDTVLGPLDAGLREKYRD